MEVNIQLSKDIFIFNLGRLWQEVSSEHWEKATYLYEFIHKTTDRVLLKKYSKSLRKLQISIEREDSKAVDKALREILKW